MKRIFGASNLLVALIMAAMVVSSPIFSQTNKGGNTASAHKVLVAYFSATGTTRGVAKTVAKCAEADIFEIVPAKPYTSADLNWRRGTNRANLEMEKEDSHPEIKETCKNLDDYDIVLLGFPIWSGLAPRIIQTFLESADFSGKTIALFCTSGGIGLGDTQSVLAKSVDKSVKWRAGIRFRAGASEKDVNDWLSKVVE